MQLNHLNLSVKDVPATRTFFETYFDFRNTDPKPNDSLSVLTGPDNFLLVLMNQRFNDQGNHAYPDAFHIGFYLEDKDAVNNMYQRLQAGGIVLEQAPQPMRKTFGFYLHFDQIMIEITTPVKD
ncbi:VOC family protein [Chitinophaga sp. 22321]|uniref:VOC family protein n=1 Tax=Chitinophaga hostae TaxID=2831022 RepID=A0ABS5JAK3_9BACT|nr:VOC family protein [Chitinophaga hostae]MBS0032234.1 VOC family protein [Chitinophaga hostae]